MSQAGLFLALSRREGRFLVSKVSMPGPSDRIYQLIVAAIALRISSVLVPALAVITARGASCLLSNEFTYPDLPLAIRQEGNCLFVIARGVSPEAILEIATLRSQ